MNRATSSSLFMSSRRLNCLSFSSSFACSSCICCCNELILAKSPSLAFNISLAVVSAALDVEALSCAALARDTISAFAFSKRSRSLALSLSSAAMDSSLFTASTLDAAAGGFVECNRKGVEKERKKRRAEERGERRQRVSLLQV